MFIHSVMLNGVRFTDVRRILEGTMEGCGLTTKYFMALRPVGGSWVVEV